MRAEQPGRQTTARENSHKNSHCLASINCSCPWLVAFCGGWYRLPTGYHFQHQHCFYSRHHHQLVVACHVVAAFTVKQVLLPLLLPLPCGFLLSQKRLLAPSLNGCKHQHCFFSHYHCWYWRWVTSLSIHSHDELS